MTAAVTSASRPLAAVPAALLPLARFEARRLLRHPVMAVGAALTVLVLGSEPLPTVHYLADTVGALVPIGLAAMVTLFLTASRTARDDATELVAPMAASPAIRQGALLLGSLAALAPVTLGIGIIAGVLRAGEGLAFATPSGIVDRVPTLLEVVTPMAAVLACAAIGGLLGRLLPFVVLIPAFAVFGIVQLIAVSWSLTSAGRWLLPFVDPTVKTDWVQVTPGSGYSIVSGVALDRIGLHLGYLVALTSLAALVTLAADHRGRGLRVATALTGCATLALAVAQLGGGV